MMTRANFLLNINRLIEAFGDKAFTTPRVEMIWDRTSDLDDLFMNKTTDTFLADNKFPPLPSEFFELARLERSSPYRQYKIPTDAAEITPIKGSIFSRQEIAEIFVMMKKRLNGEISYEDLEQYALLIGNAISAKYSRRGNL